MGGYAFDRGFRPTVSLASSGDIPGLLSESNESPAFVLAGVDEAGRGPLAGPVVAAAVVLPVKPVITGLRDSKTLTADRREKMFDEIHGVALAFSVSVIHADEIDAINILAAAMKAMRNAILGLAIRPDLVIVDGNQRPKSGLPERAVIKADTRSACVMAASVIAKVTRDRWMREAHVKYPVYGFDQHKGYGAPTHLEALKKHGPCEIHRKTFAPVRQALEEKESLLT